MYVSRENIIMSTLDIKINLNPRKGRHTTIDITNKRFEDSITLINRVMRRKFN